MTMGEFLQRNRQGVHEIMEIPVGYDGIVVAFRRDLPAPDISLGQLWLGIATEVPH